jgi:hypothetical protein
MLKDSKEVVEGLKELAALEQLYTMYMHIIESDWQHEQECPPSEIRNAREILKEYAQKVEDRPSGVRIRIR